MFDVKTNKWCNFESRSCAPLSPLVPAQGNQIERSFILQKAEVEYTLISFMPRLDANHETIKGANLNKRLVQYVYSSNSYTTDCIVPLRKIQVQTNGSTIHITKLSANGLKINSN